ncbi:unnamed protein product [Rotaria sordida]|uniref:Uncharacterized protein n=1 Tax=Rotaria sordida TaxID=392033 RepID=A0A819A5A7_9BILA|nr:unnamed protein product [Rotaria sordida]
MNDYEKRFQRSIQKLTVPSWYTDTKSSLNIINNSKQSIISTTSIPWKTSYKELQRTPEILCIHVPHSYRSCRSSIATSPSPSIHSWHPNILLDGSKRQKKYEKGVERVSKSSRWYQPTQFIANETINIHTGNIKVSTSTKHKQPSSKNNHYDTPKIHRDDESLILKSNLLVANGDIEKNIITEQTQNMITNEKQQDNHIKSNESQIMPLAITKEPFSHIELEDVTDEEHDNRSLSMKNNNLTPTITNLSLSNEKSDDNELLERVANDLVETVLTDILHLQNLDHDDDKNSGVRELSEDENGLRELDENDMNDTDEFIVFATKPGISNDDEQISNIPRYSLNKLYTFSKTHHNSIHNSKQTTLNQNTSSTSILEKKDVIATNSQLNSNTEELFDQIFSSSPIESQNIILNEYIDKIMCPSNSHIENYRLSEGVNEETARIGRLLLGSIPTSFIDDVHNTSQTPISVQSKLKNTRFIVPDQNDIYDSPRKIYSQTQQRIHEEYDEELNDEVHRDSAYSSNQERINMQQLHYESLSECYSGYSFIQSDFLTPNISSLQSTTDEAYESEPTTMTSSVKITKHIHPNLEHEFEYPSPPPPVPDRRLKPNYLKSPTIKSRLIQQDNIDTVEYSIIQKPKLLPLTSVQQLVISTSNNSNLSSTQIMNSRHYCGSIPVSNKLIQSCIDTITIKSKEDLNDKIKDKRNSRVLNCLHSSKIDDNNNNNNNYKRNTIPKSPPSSLNKMKTKKRKLITDFDEATNGLAILLPASKDNLNDLTNKQNSNKTSTPLTTKRVNGMIKDQRVIDNVKSDRSVFYETSV